MTTAADFVPQLKEKFGDLLSEPTEFRGEITVCVTEPEFIAEVCAFAKSKLGFDYLLDISTLDHYGEDPRFTVVYELSGIEHRNHLRLKTHVSEEKGELPSVTNVWRTADWHEREAFDMMGVRFNGHPNLKRILMWDSYPYHPLRKDFPLAGIEVPLPAEDVAEVTQASVEPAPMMGGPFVSPPHGRVSEAEPRAKDESWTEELEKPS